MKQNERCKLCVNYGNAFSGEFCRICENGDMYKRKPKPIDYAGRYTPKSTLPIQNVIFSPPATIVMWNDGTKTVVKCENEGFDPEKGLAMAIAKRALGNKGNYYNEFKKWIDAPESEEVE